MSLRILFFLLLIFTVISCEDEEPTAEEIVVVDAVLTAEQPFEGLRLWRLASLNEPLNQPYSADAVVIRSSEDYFLVPSADLPGTYIDPSGQLVLTPGDPYQLIIVKGEKIVASGVQSPAKPQGLSVAQSSYAIDAVIQSSGGSVDLNWSNPNSAFYFGHVQLLDEPLQVINPQLNSVTEATLDVIGGASYQIPFKALNYYGTYRFILYAVGAEYLNFFGRNGTPISVQQVTNISNGLGIFTVITSDTVQFQIIPN